jgi:hypothetical protein
MGRWFQRPFLLVLLRGSSGIARCKEMQFLHLEVPYAHFFKCSLLPVDPL